MELYCVLKFGSCFDTFALIVPACYSDIGLDFISQVEKDILADCLITFLDHGSRGKAALEGLVKRLGGEVRSPQAVRSF